MEIEFQKETAHQWREIFADVVPCEQSREWTLPEECPDVGKILLTDGEVFLSGKEIADGMIYIKGSVFLTVLYETEEKRMLAACRAELPLTCQIPCSAADPGCRLIVSATLSSCSGEMRSNRALRLSAQTLLSVSCRKEEEFLIRCFPKNAGKNLQTQSFEDRAIIPEGVCEKSFALTKSIPLGAQRPSMKELLLSVSEIRITSEQVLGSRVLVKGLVYSVLLYTENGSQIPVRTRLETEFSQVIETEIRHAEKARVTAMLTGAILHPELSLEPEASTISAEYHIVLQAVVGREIVVSGISDAYIPCRTCMTTIQEEKLGILPETPPRQVSFRGIVPAENVGREVLYIALHPEKEKVSNEDGQCVVSGKLNAALLALRRDGSVQGNIGQIAWQECIPGGTGPAWVSVSEDAFGVPSAGGYDVRGTAALSFVREETVAHSVITEIRSDEAQQKSDTEASSLLLHRYQSEETLWGLAKEADSTVESIQIANNLTEGEIIPKEKLLILPRISE